MATNVKSKRQPQKVQKADNSSLMVYGAISAVLLVLVLGVYTFGIDLGFIHLFGTPDIRILYVGAVLCLVLSYLVDIFYIKTVRKFFNAGETWQMYIPYFNFSCTFDKKSSIATLIGGILIAVIALPAYTPLGRYLPVDYLVTISSKSIWIILILGAAYSVLRGIYALKFKRKAEELYKKHISESYGSGGSVNKVAYIIYFLPIIRSISLLTDINFLKSVKFDLDSMRRNER